MNMHAIILSKKKRVPVFIRVEKGIWERFGRGNGKLNVITIL